MRYALMTQKGRFRLGVKERAELKAVYELLHLQYESVLQELVKGMRNTVECHGYAPTIKSRIKRFDAYFEKLQRPREGEGGGKAPELTDILGVRVICPFLEDVDAVEGFLVEAFDVIELERKGASHSFREFGYDSVHLLLRIEASLLPELLPYTAPVVEVQLRTLLQDAWAEVEHELIYKSDISLPNASIKRKLASLNASLTLSDLIFQELRDYQKEIRERDRKRRQSLEENARFCPVMPGMGEETNHGRVRLPLGAKEDLSSLTGQRKLEKAMLDALDAHSRGDLLQATTLYGQILRHKLSEPIRALVYNHRGMAYFGLSEYRKAIRDFSKSIEIDEKNVRCFNNRALTFRVMKRFDRSLDDYDASLALNPSQVEGYWGRAQTHYEMQLYTQALSDCEKALGIQADFKPAQELIKRINSQVF